MNEMRNIYQETPFYGYRRMTIELKKMNYMFNHKNETIPNQLGKQVQNPTLRWIFQISKVWTNDVEPQLKAGIFEATFILQQLQKNMLKDLLNQHYVLCNEKLSYGEHYLVPKKK
jgi:hypothetical protein